MDTLRGHVSAHHPWVPQKGIPGPSSLLLPCWGGGQPRASQSEREGR